MAIVAEGPQCQPRHSPLLKTQDEASHYSSKAEDCPLNSI